MASPHLEFRLPFDCRVGDRDDDTEGYDWTEVYWDATADDYVSPDSPRSGTGNLFGLNGEELTPGLVATIRFRSVVDENPTYEVVGSSAFSAAIVTGPIGTGGLWPALLTAYDQGAALWNSTSAVRLLPLNGEPLTIGKRYGAFPAGGERQTPPIWLAIPTCCGADDPPPDGAACFCLTSKVFCVTVAGVTRAADFDCNFLDFNQYCTAINRTFTMRYVSSSLEPGGGITCFWADTSNAHCSATLQITSAGDATLYLVVSRGYPSAGTDISVTYHLNPFVCDGSNVMTYGGGEPGACCDNWPGTVTVGACGEDSSGGCDCAGTLYTQLPSIDYGGGDVTDPFPLTLVDVGGCQWAADSGGITAVLDMTAVPITLTFTDGRGGSATYSAAAPLCDSNSLTFVSQTGSGTWPGTASYGNTP